MSERLWTGNFTRMCVANGLLFASIGVLLPILPFLMAVCTKSSIALSGITFLLLISGALLMGPFYAILVDLYKRKLVCILSFAAMIATTGGYIFAKNVAVFVLFIIIQGLAFGIAASSGITIAIDITNPKLRSAGNLRFSWVGCIGFFTGIFLGICKGLTFEERIFIPAINDLFVLPVIIGAIGILFLISVYVPFRSPNITCICSFDRFLLLRAWIPALNLVLITFLFGVLILSATFMSIFGLFGDRWSTFYKIIPLFIYLATVFAYIWMSSKFLRMLVNLSHHCQRGTANATHLLANGLGFALSVVFFCCFYDYSLFDNMELSRWIFGLLFCMVALFSIFFYVLITRPYYKRKRVR